MSIDCNISNPLRRGGTNKQERLVKALLPAYAKIDERSMQEMLWIISQYTRQINYFDQENKLDGTWEELIDPDISALLATVSLTNFKTFQQQFEQLSTALLKLAKEPANNEAAIDQNFRQLVDLVGSLAKAINTWLTYASNYSPFYEEIALSIRSGLDNQLKLLILYDYDLSQQRQEHYFNKGVYLGYQEVWKIADWVEKETYQKDYDKTKPIIYVGATESDKIRNAVKQIKLLFDAFYKEKSVLIANANTHFNNTLNQSYQRHEPHNALILAFLQLFKYAQDHINTLTGRHLDYYYKEVLQLTSKAATPDQVNIVFQLAQNIRSYLLKKGTTLSAGKDKTGVELLYKTDNDIALNKATARLFKTIYVDKTATAGSGKEISAIYAAPVANSLDGIGEELDKTDPKWHTFGESQQGKSIQNRNMVDATLGFALASPILFLAEGKRRITFRLYLDTPIDPTLIPGMEIDLKNNLAVYLSGAEEWIKKPITSVTISKATIPADKVPPAVETKILDFINNAKTAVDIAGKEPQAGPVYDDPGTGYGDQIKDYDIGITVAQRIINRRAVLGSFTNIDQLKDIKGFGKDKLADLIYTFAPATINFVIDLDKKDKAIVAYQANKLGHTFDTQWPVCKVVLQNNQPALQLFTLTFYNKKISYAKGNYVISHNTVYRSLQDNNKLAPGQESHWLKLEKTQDFIKDYTNHLHAYDKDATYATNILIKDDKNKIYKAIKASTSPTPSLNSAYWGLIRDFDFEKTKALLQLPPAYDPQKTYTIGDEVLYGNNKYSAIKNSTSPPPGNLSFWKPLIKTGFPYQYLYRLPLKKVNIHVKVNEVRDLLFQNDQSVLLPGKPFQPFGAKPVNGSAFYVGSTEVFKKQLDTLQLNLQWKDLPEESFAKHYFAYDQEEKEVNGKKTIVSNIKIDNDYFKTQLSILDQKVWQPTTGPEKLTLVETDPAHPDKKPKVRTKLAVKNIDKIKVARDTSATKVEELDVKTQKGFLKLTLISPEKSDGTPGSFPDTPFGHNHYSQAFTEAILKKQKNNNFKIPNEPYTPVIKSLSLDYSSSVTFDMTDGDKKAYQNRVERFFYLHPFGDHEVHPYTFQDIKLLPEYSNEGSLYIGLKDLNPPQNISVFFQLAEGSGDPDLGRPQIEWSYLSKNKWVKLDKLSILSDTTNGLLRSGIILFDIAKKADAKNTLLPANYHWLSVTVPNKSAAIDQTIGITTQAVSASFSDNKNDPDHLGQPLAAKSISKLDKKNAAIKSVAQPYNSYGGKVKEQQNDFYARVSERLRHKARAITIWDYEHLVLEQFQFIYKVKCLNHTNSQAEIAPGFVTLIVIPNLRNKNAVNLLEPKTSLTHLEEIKDHVKKFISPFISLEVQNPVYEQIKVKFDVGFHKGKDAGLFGKKLNEDIKRFLSPWAYEEGQDIVFGGKIHRSDILNFVEERAYVDFVNNFKMYHITGGQMSPDDKDVVRAEATTSRSVLVSFKDHAINVLKSGEYECEGGELKDGIGHMIVDVNFLVR